ncbi:MAG TPA: C45 family autoproteolytic acyltransferase/hydrolase [Candidatus Polarisedimenticolia bacterium]|nr:C45 family autoproteolytic acyltransferase/hydrolase [Candidatus Polarisedimenticolia bacterium]
MLHRLPRAVPPCVLLIILILSGAGCLAAAPSSNVVQEDRVIAGGPGDSLEVRHLVLRGTNEQIGQALAEIAKERYGVRLDRVRDLVQARAQRTFLERNYPILVDRMRGVAAAFGKSFDEDGWDFGGLGFTDLRAGCSIVHLPPSSTVDGKSVVSRDYDFTTGALSFGFLPPGMLHPTARPYLVELYPDKGYASIAMVAYDLLSGVLDGINSEGLTVTLAMDDEIFSGGTPEPTREPAVGLGELQTLRLLLDTCATVEEAKQTLMATKQYYQYVPIHYLIADRFGNAFVWEYSQQHNKEYIVESPGQPLIMTNFTLHTRLEDGKPPSPEKARPTCKRYAYLREKLATGKFDDKALRGFHQNVDAQMSQAADPSHPPERTFWHAFYYPEDRRVRLSYYLRDEPYPGNERLVRPVRTDYLEFRLKPSGSKPGMAQMPAASTSPAAGAGQAVTTPPEASAPSTGTAPADIGAALEAAGGTIERKGSRLVAASLGKATGLATILPLLARIPDLETLSLGNPALTEADLRALEGLPKLRSLGLMGAPVGDTSLAVMKTLPALRELNISGTKVTDAGLASLRDLVKLEYLGLKGTIITDAGLVHLKGLTGLTSLNLADTRVSDAGLVSLTGLARLESVNLSNDNVSDAGLATLARMPALAGINATGTKVTDAGLVHLKTLPKLTKLNVTGTAVTEQGVKDAKKFLPFWATVTR